MDACAEFFFAPCTGKYTNVECNAIGAMLIGTGEEITDGSKHAPHATDEQIQRIERWASAGGCTLCVLVIVLVIVNPTIACGVTWYMVHCISGTVSRHPMHVCPAPFRKAFLLPMHRVPTFHCFPTFHPLPHHAPPRTPSHVHFIRHCVFLRTRGAAMGSRVRNTD